MTLTLSKWGNSLGLRIPQSFADQLGLDAGSQLAVQLDGKKIVLSPAKLSLDALIDKVTPENLHTELLNGPPVGREKI